MVSAGVHQCHVLQPEPFPGGRTLRQPVGGVVRRGMGGRSDPNTVPCRLERICGPAVGQEPCAAARGDLRRRYRRRNTAGLVRAWGRSHVHYGCSRARSQHRFERIWRELPGWGRGRERRDCLPFPDHQRLQEHQFDSAVLLPSVVWRIVL